MGREGMIVMFEFKRPKHVIIAKALGLMDHDFLIANQCWFGGGTAIVLKLGEYRQSLDIDFLCSDPDGYRALRMAAVELGVRAFFRKPVEAVREMRIDQYGLRSVVQLDGQPFKFEVVREARVALQGRFDDDLGVPALVCDDMFAEKLLANADRCQDRAVAYRDAIDLGMLICAFGKIPPEALAKAQAAYGLDIGNKVAWVANRLQDSVELRDAALALQMDPDVAGGAVSALRAEGDRVWPDAGIDRTAAASAKLG